MLKSSISDRIIFPSEKEQVQFLLDIKKSKNESWKNIALEWKINVRTLSDWKNAVRHMPYELAVSSSQKLKIKLPEGSTRLKWSDHASEAGVKGAKINLLKNGKIGGDSEYRKKKWREWWEIKGKFIPFPIFQQKDILFPKFNKQLAEFVGIMLGDGGITPYCITISLNKNEIGYADFVQKLIKKLFGVSSKIYFMKTSEEQNIVVQRKKMVDFLGMIGIPKGNKIEHGVYVPDWIMNNIKFQKACIRGLIDTDGCIFIHKYKSNGKIYRYQKIDFTSSSRPLLDSAYKILINLGFSVRICKNGKALRIESQKDVVKYLKIIGTNNPRYGGKLKNWRSAGAVNGTVC
ncbi:MAG: LAGLIDADG family homing endonuclease [bacterium]